MPVEKDLRDHLIADAGVSALVGTRVYTGRVNSYTFPLVLFRHSGGTNDNGLGGEGSLRNPIFQFDCFAKKAIDASILSEAVRAALGGASTFRAQAISTPVAFYEDDQQAHRLVFEVSVWHTA